MIDKIRNAFDKVLPAAAAIFLLIGVLSTSVGVIDRTFGLNLKTVWAEEITRYSIIWAAMLLMGIGFRKGTQTRLTLLSERLSDKPRKLVEIIVYLLVLFMFGILMVYGMKSALLNGGQKSVVLQISMFWPYLAIPTGSFFVVFEVAVMLFRTITRKPNTDKTGVVKEE